MPTDDRRCLHVEPGDWADAPQALGMTVAEDGALVGTWEGRVPVRAVHVRKRIETHTRDNWEAGTPVGSNTYYYHHDFAFSTEYRATLDPVLLMGMAALQMPPAAPTRTGFDPARGTGIDLHFQMLALDPDHLHRMLVPVLAEMLRYPDAPTSLRTRSLVITDRDVSATSSVPDWLVDPDALRAGFAVVGRVADLVLAWRTQDPAAWEPALRSCWAEVAERRGLRFDPARVAMTGHVRGLPVEVVARLAYEPTRLTTAFRVGFGHPLGCSLSLAKDAERGALGTLFHRFFGGQDILVGDPAFDAAFVVRGEPVDKVRAVLAPPARACLLGLLARFPAIHVEDDALTFTADELVVSADTLEALVDQGLVAAGALGSPVQPG